MRSTMRGASERASHVDADAAVPRWTRATFPPLCAPIRSAHRAFLRQRGAPLRHLAAPGRQNEHVRVDLRLAVPLTLGTYDGHGHKARHFKRATPRGFVLLGGRDVKAGAV